MRNLCIITLLFICTISQAQIVDIPDANFKDLLVNYACVDTDGDGVYESDADTNDDGEIQVSEAEAVIRLLVNSPNIISIEGIQSFTNLEIYFSISTQVTNLDFSQNSNLRELTSFYGILTNINISENINLERLFCPFNNLTNLDVSYNPNLTQLMCYNNQLTSLDVTNNSNLFILNCFGNQLNELDISQNPSLRDLYCGSNQILDLDLSNNTYLEKLYCLGNQITNLDLSLNVTIESVNCTNNQLTNLNIKNGNNTNMTIMHSFNNPNLTCIQVDNENATYPICDFENFIGWCKDDWAEYSEECIFATEDNITIDFTLYPNPSQNILFIESQEQIENVKIYTLQGQLINPSACASAKASATRGRSGTKGITRSVDVSNLKTGLYFVQVRVDGKSETKKFVKE